MAVATLYKDGRKALAEMLRLVDGASTPAGLGRLLTCTIGNGQAPEFTNPAAPPPVDPDDIYPGIRGAVLTNGTKSNPVVQYLVPAVAGAIAYADQLYDESVDPTDILMLTWLFNVSDAVGEWREIVFSFANSNRLYAGIHPVGTGSGWQVKTNAEQRPVRLLIEL